MWHTRKTIQQDAQTGLFCLSSSSGLSGLNKQTRQTNKPNNVLLLLTDFFSILLKEGNP
jgi:hypothetical protein